MLLQDPTNKAILRGQIEAAVGNEFAKVDNQNAFAGTVVDKLVEDGTIKADVVAEAIKKYGISADKLDPVTV